QGDQDRPLRRPRASARGPRPRSQDRRGRLALTQAASAGYPQLRKIDTNRWIRPGLTGPTDGQMCQPWPVSANLELVRSIYAATERGDYTWAAWAHSEIELVIVDGPTPGNWKGI